MRTGATTSGITSVMVVLLHQGPAADDKLAEKSFGEDVKRLRAEWEGKIWQVDDTERLQQVLQHSEAKDFTCPAGTKYRIDSCHLQRFDGLSNPPTGHPTQLLFGEANILYDLCGCTFEVSHGSFFQVNSSCAEVLYGVVIDEVKASRIGSSPLVMFDVCCGTGSIGISCAKAGACDKVVGCDISEPAIRDANENAKRNEVADRCLFEAGRAENVLGAQVKAELSTATAGASGAGADKAQPLKEGDSSVQCDATPTFVAVVDPARSGLHLDVVRTLRATRCIEKVIYVSCNPDKGLPIDAGPLCGPTSKKYLGVPFQVTKAQPVDMFPLTDHCEMVMVFERGEMLKRTMELKAAAKTAGSSSEANAESSPVKRKAPANSNEDEKDGKLQKTALASDDEGRGTGDA